MIMKSRFSFNALASYKRVSDHTECKHVCLLPPLLLYTTRNKPSKERHQRVQRYTGLILKLAIFVKVLRSKVMARNTSEKANMLISLSSPQAVFAHFRDQRSTGTTWRTTGESSVVSEVNYRGRGPASGENRQLQGLPFVCALFVRNLRMRVW